MGLFQGEYGARAWRRVLSTEASQHDAGWDAVERAWAATRMPLDREVAFLAVDEVQLAADADRGHIFTDRILHARGTNETMFLGAETIKPLIRRLVPGTEFISRPRFSKLLYTGSKKLTRLPRRSAYGALVLGFGAVMLCAAELVEALFQSTTEASPAYVACWTASFVAFASSASPLTSTRRRNLRICSLPAPSFSRAAHAAHLMLMRPMSITKN